MSIKSFLGSLWATNRARKVNKAMNNALELQEKTLKQLIARSQHTAFGKDHHFDEIHTYEDFKARVPIRNYEQSRPWLDRVVKGEEDISWPGKPLYLAKTSGTTSGAKYIPISKESIQCQVAGARDALMMYMSETAKTGFLNGKMMFLSGSPEIEENEYGIKTGRLSGIVNHFVPSYLQRNKVPTYEANIIEDWEEKVKAIVKEVSKEDLRLISGIPPWVQMFFEELEAQTGKQPLEVWPNLQVFVQGGVDYSPYAPIFDQYFQDRVDIVEVFPASEGFFAYQNTQEDDGLMLMPDNGIFFEFVPMDEYGKEDPQRLSLGEVEKDVQYALILSSNAGLWAYDIGDTVKFTSLEPFKLRVTGRVKHFISAFGEHVISEEVNKAILEAQKSAGGEFQEFTVAPLIVEAKGESAHEWLIEFTEIPSNWELFIDALDQALRKQNAYYDDLRDGNILRKAEVKAIQLNASREYMKAQGKLGGQNKFPRLSNDRKIADFLYGFLLENS